MKLGKIKVDDCIKKELNYDQLMERWFSIVEKELPLTSTEYILLFIKGITPASVAQQEHYVSGYLPDSMQQVGHRKQFTSAACREPEEF